MQAPTILGILFQAAFVLATASAVVAQDSTGAAPKIESTAENQPDIQEYKTNYVPLEFRPLRGDRAEYIDLGVLAALLTSGTWMVLKRVRARWLLLQLFFSLLYLGFWRGGCICPIGAASDVCHALFHPERIGRITLLLFLTPLVFALFAGRVFCGSVCPLGAIQHLLIRRSQPVVLPKWLDRILMIGPILLLLAILWNSVHGPSFLVCRLDPFATAFLFGKASLHHFASQGTTSAAPALPMVGSAMSWAFLCGSLILCTVVALPFCRYICPFGVLLGLASLVAFKQRVPHHSRCGVCGRCKRVCPTQAITVDRQKMEIIANFYKCVQCSRCDEICHRQVFAHTHNKLLERRIN